MQDSVLATYLFQKNKQKLGYYHCYVIYY